MTFGALFGWVLYGVLQPFLALHDRRYLLALFQGATLVMPLLVEEAWRAGSFWVAC